MPTGKLEPMTVLLFIGTFLSAIGLVLAYHFYPELNPIVKGYIDSIAGGFAVSFFAKVGYHFALPGQPGSATGQAQAAPAVKP